MRASERREKYVELMQTNKEKQRLKMHTAAANSPHCS
jgi:hypothetical protein